MPISAKMCHQLTFSVLQLRKLIDSEKLGQILAFQGVWSVLKPLSYFEIQWRRETGSGGPVWFLSCFDSSQMNDIQSLSDLDEPHTRN